MNKREFLDKLKERLSGLPESEIEERLNFFDEMIDDRAEEGIPEEEAVAELGTVDDVAGQIVAEIPLSKLVKEKVRKKRRMRAWEIVLLAVGSPIWLSLLIACFAVIISLYAIIWSIVISVWACFGALAGCAVGGIAGGVVLTVLGKVPAGVALIGAGIACAGLSIFAFYGSRAATKGIVALTKKIIIGIKNMIVRKESEK